MRMTPPPRARADAGTLLSRAVVAHAARHGVAARVRDWRDHPWASATFVGARHRATLVVDGDAAAWLAALRDAELPLAGNIVADIGGSFAADGTVALEALTLDSA